MSSVPPSSQPDATELAVERERFHSLFMHAPACIAVMTGPKLTYELANPDYRQLFGLKRDIVGRTLTEVLPDLDDELLAIIRGVATKGVRFTANERPVHVDWLKNGKPFTKYFNLVYEPLFSKNKKPNGLMVFANDVTDQVIARQKIAESETYYRDMADHTPIMTWVTDAKANTTYRNKQWYIYTGQKTGSISLKSWVKAIHPEDAQRAVELYEHAFRRRRPVSLEYRLRNYAGVYHWMLDRALPRFDADGEFKGFVGAVVDIDERKRIEYALRTSEESLRFMAESMPEMVFTVMPNGRVGYFSPQWTDYTGLGIRKLLELDWNKPDGLVHPDDVEQTQNKWNEAWKAGESLEQEFRLLRKDGSYRWHISRVNPMKAENGSIVMWVGSCTDIDDMKRATQKEHELEMETAMLAEQSRELMELNQAKDEFISLASHQLRTPATGVKQYLGMLLQGYVGELTDEQRSFLKTAYDSNERQLAIVNDLLQVAQVDAGKVRLQKGPTELVGMLRDIIDEQAARFEARQQRVIFKPPESSMTVLADEDRIRMVLENIIDNASKYTRAQRTITVSITRTARTIKIAVKDQGVGIAHANIDKIFNKFSRLNNPLSTSFDGSGLGLYWAKKIIDLHEGNIEVRSVIGKGTTFTVILPHVVPVTQVKNSQTKRSASTHTTQRKRQSAL